ncbi:uncharacterized protein LOC127812017 [Diospyros lotus]|uniref:uncharacterized protein LOC127812017 n=1 Tax=Diospyros lotus TaxID=55363 RepID=UPI002257CBF1|nr:uncharacterized protein LOC127812017 [Diospyros lotus]
MAEIKEENKQMHDVASFPGVFITSLPALYRLDDKGSTEFADRLSHRIQERINKHCFLDWYEILSKKIYVNNVFVSDHKPIVVSIGLNYRDTIKSEVMEFYKISYMKRFFERTNTDLKEFLRDTVNSFIPTVSMCQSLYNWNDELDVLMEMFIVDGGFIIELFWRNGDIKGNEFVDTILMSEWVLYAFSRDLILRDNQLPFQVLTMLFERTGLSAKLDQHDSNHHHKLTGLAFKFLERIVPNQKLDHKLVNIHNPNQDLLSTVYDGLSWLRPKANNNYNSNIDKDKKDIGDEKWNLVKSATELQEFGVEFKMVDTDNLVYITLNKGVLCIPRIRIRYGTAYSINVLLQFENSILRKEPGQPRCLTDYLWFMNSLVKSPNDVQLLRQKNIIDNLSELPDDAAILKFLKDLHESLMISPANFSYKEICRNLNVHCSHRRNSWLAKLKRDYFNSPWAIISFFAASLLLILTVAQTGFSVASYYNQG